MDTMNKNDSQILVEEINDNDTPLLPASDFASLMPTTFSFNPLSVNAEALTQSAQVVADTLANQVVTDETYMVVKNVAMKEAREQRDLAKKTRRELNKAMKEALSSATDALSNAERIIETAIIAKQNEIEVFDDKRRIARNDKCHKQLEKLIAKSGLRQEFADRIVTSNLENNLTATQKAIMADYSTQIDNLKAEQDQADQITANKEALMAVATTACEMANQTISQKIAPDAFLGDIDSLSEELHRTIEEMSAALSEKIQNRAQSIREAEEKIREDAIRKEQERLKKEAETNAAIPEESLADDSTATQENVEIDKTIPSVTGKVNPFLTNTKPEPEIWEGSITLSGTADDLSKVLAILEQAAKNNNVEYKVTSSGRKN